MSDHYVKNLQTPLPLAAAVTVNASLEIPLIDAARATVRVENLFDETTRLGASGVFTMVAIDESGQPAAVLPWVPDSDEDLLKFNQAKTRRQVRCGEQT